MASLEWTSRSERHDRECYLLAVDGPDDIPADFELACEHFVCLLACEAGDLPFRVLIDLTERLLEAGCSAVCAWGEDCRRVRDVFVGVIADREVVRGIDGPKAMTLAMPEGLDEALFYLLSSCSVFEPYEASSRAAVVILIDQPPEVEQRVRYALSDPDGYPAQAAEAEEFEGGVIEPGEAS